MRRRATSIRTKQTTPQRSEVIAWGEMWPGAHRPATALPAQSRAVSVRSG